MEELLRKLGEISEKDEAYELVKRGLECLEELDLKNAARLLKEAVDADLGEAYCGFGTYLLEKKQPKKAEAVYMKAAELNPESAYLCLSVCYFFQNRLKESEFAFEKSLESIPADKTYGPILSVIVYNSIAIRYQLQDKHEEAEAAFTKAADAMKQIPESKRKP